MGFEFVAKLPDLILEGSVGRDELLKFIVLVLQGFLQPSEVLVSVLPRVHQLFQLKLVLLCRLDLVDAELSDLLLPGHDLHLEILDPFGHLLLVLLVQHVDLSRAQRRVMLVLGPR